MKSHLAAFFTIFGLACLALAVFLCWQRTTPRRLSFNMHESHTSRYLHWQNRLKTLREWAKALSRSGGNNEYETYENIGLLEPKTLVIRDLGIELPISPARVEKGKWEASTKGVSYLSTSPIPGEMGNSILYGHNWPNLLGNLVKTKAGQEVAVLFNDDSIKKFVIKTIQVVTPEQTNILDSSDDQRVTLYTCTGFLDRKRLVVTAIEANKL